MIDFYRYSGNGRVYSLVKSIKQRKHEVVELDHTYRINGVIDIFKLNFLVYDFELQRLITFTKLESLSVYVDSCLVKYKPRNITEARSIKYIDSDEKKVKALKVNTVAEDYAIRNSEVGDDDMYFIFVDGRVKIGRSKDYKKRFKQMETAFPSMYFAYIFVGYGSLEKRMHKVFEEYKTKGEWFEDNDRIRRFCQVRLDNVGKILHNPFELSIKSYNQEIYSTNYMSK